MSDTRAPPAFSACGRDERRVSTRAGAGAAGSGEKETHLRAQALEEAVEGDRVGPAVDDVARLDEDGVVAGPEALEVDEAGAAEDAHGCGEVAMDVACCGSRGQPKACAEVRVEGEEDGPTATMRWWNERCTRG